MKKLAAVLGGVFYVAAYLGTFGFHLLTSYLANLEYGAFWGIIVFLTPPFSDLYWLGYWIFAHGFNNYYMGCLYSLIAAIVLAVSLTTWAES